MWSSNDTKSLREEEELENFSYATQLVNSTAMSMCLQTAVELRVFDIIAKAGSEARLSASDIAAHLPITNNPDAPLMLDRVLRLLASYSVLSCSGEGGDVEGSGFKRLYGLAPVSKYFVTNEDGVSFCPLVSLIQDKVFLDSWSELKNAIREGGIPFNRFHGPHAFEYPGLDARFNKLFNRGMYNHTIIVMKNILDSDEGFTHLKRLVNVGGGLGVTLNLITSKYPYIKGISFDLPHVLEHAPPHPGVEHVGGDMFENVPNGDAIFMKWILHDWTDEDSLKLLKNCYKAIPSNGKVIVVEAILPDMPDTSSAVKSAFQSDVIMMTQNPGGKERNQQEFLALATGAGFSGIKFECCVCNLWVMEFFK